MKRTLFVLMAGGGVLVVLWLGYGTFVYMRNRIPPLSFLSAPPPLEVNVYEQLVDCVRSVRNAQELAALEREPMYGSIAQKQKIVTANQQLLQKLRYVIQQPAMVMNPEYQVGDPTAEDYVSLARLIITEGKLLEQNAQYAQAIDSYIDGLIFFEKILNGGNALHLIYSYMPIAMICDASRSAIPHLSAQQAQKAASRMESLLSQEYPLRILIEQDFRRSLLGWKRIVDGMSMRGFKMDFPKVSLERELLYLPKKPVTLSAQKYVRYWIAQAKLPYPQQSFIEYPDDLKRLPTGLIVRPPEDIVRFISYYTDTRTRLRLVYTHLRLQQFRKEHGRYPVRLSELGDSHYFIDPFSAKPFIYRLRGNTFTLYSVGPNTRDDGGTTLAKGNMPPRERPGDILWQ